MWKRQVILSFAIGAVASGCTNNGTKEGPFPCGESITEIPARRPDTSAVNISFEPVWEIALTAEEPNWSVARVRSIAELEGGQLVVVDPTRRMVWLTDAKGHKIRELGRKGTGPEEYRQPYVVSLDDQGNVWVFDRGEFKLLAYDKHGRLLRVTQAPGSTEVRHIGGERLIHRVFSEQRFLVSDDEGNPLMRMFDVSGCQGELAKITNHGMVATDSLFIVTTNMDNTLRLYEMSSGQLRDRVLIDERQLPEGFFSLHGQVRKGNREFTGAWDSTAHLLDLHYVSGLDLLVVLVVGPCSEEESAGRRQCGEYRMYDSGVAYLGEVPLEGGEAIIQAGQNSLYVLEYPRERKDPVIPLIRKVRVRVEPAD